MRTISLSESQTWVMLYALVEMSSEESERRLLKKFPDMDISELAKDMEGILKQLESPTTPGENG